MMEENNPVQNIAILGGGPSALFLYKRLTEFGGPGLHISIFEKKGQLGAGMPYSPEGANLEHITNVSGNEIPQIVTSIKQWIRTAPLSLLQRFDMKAELFNEYEVVPRLLFGEYLQHQFTLLQQVAKKAGIITEIFYNTTVTDIKDETPDKKVKVFTQAGDSYSFDAVIISTGHHWPVKQEGTIPNWFDSPYPPHKLEQQVNFPIAIKGSSLTAIDAIRTLARHNGIFNKKEDGMLEYKLNKESEGFKLVMHSIDGLLPAIRFHLEDTHLGTGSLISKEETYKVKEAHGGFIPLDYIFEKHFKQPLRQEMPEYYERIAGMTMEQFVDHIMNLRERMDAFQLFKAEFAEAEKSIRQHRSIYWKEMLATLSYAMNYPAKHMSAEDMLRLRIVLMPLISIVIAFVPQSSCRELMALHDAGVLSLVAVDEQSKIVPVDSGGAMYNYTDEDGTKQRSQYKMFIDAVGQPHLMFEDFPFASLRETGTISKARLMFKNTEAGKKEMASGNKQVTQDSSGNYYLQVPGININDHFQVLDRYGAYNNRIYIMAVPYIGGLNPDYSGLDFCETASGIIVKALLQIEALP